MESAPAQVVSVSQGWCWWKCFQTWINSYFLSEEQDQAVQRLSAKHLIGCTAVWGCAVPDQSAGPPLAGCLPAPPLLLPSHSCFVHWTRCPLRKVINHNYLICLQSPSHSSAHSFSLCLSRLLHPSLPSCRLPLLFLFNFTRDQCCCQAIYLFRAVPQTKGTQKATAALPQIWPASVNFLSRVSSWQWQASLDACEE